MNVIVIIENILSSCEFTYCENLIFGALELHFQARKLECLSLCLKFLSGHFIFGYNDEFLSNRSDF